MLGKNQFSQVFKVGEVIESGAGERKNAAHLKILTIEDDLFRYQSIHNTNAGRMKYSYLQMLLDDFESLESTSIQKSVNRVLKKANFKPNYSTENYAFSFAKAFHERTNQSIFTSTGEFLVDDSSPPTSQEHKYMEGGRVKVQVELIERDPKARQKCIQHFGAWCRVCEIDFEKTYGSIGKGYIHVHHHRRQLSSTQGKHQIDPINDLVPLCPNCHAMVHRNSKEMLSIEELREHMTKAADCPKSPS